MSNEIIIAESRLFEPSELLYELFGIHLYVDMFSNKQYTLIKEDSSLEEFNSNIAKPIINNLVRELQTLHNYEIVVSVKKEQKNGKEQIVHETFSSKHIKLDFVQVMYGQFQPHKDAIWARTSGSPYDFFNRFYRPELLDLQQNLDGIPPLFDKLIDNLTTNSTEKHALINWLAYYYQTLRKSKVAWVIKGEKGTGKGILKNILRNIYGMNYIYSEVSAKSITAQFNSHWKDKLFIVFEEVNLNSLNLDNGEIHAKIKDIIVENVINIEAKGQDMKTNYPFHSNIMFFSNKENPIEVESGDRRLNMLDAQTKLNSYDWWEAGAGGTGDQLESMKMAKEVAQFFANYQCDAKLYDSTIENEVWHEAIEANLDNEYIFCKKLLENDMEWFLDHSSLQNAKQFNSSFTWASYIKNILFNKEYLHNGKIRVNKLQLKAIYEVIYDSEPNLKIFNKLLGKTKQYTVNSKAIMCHTLDYISVPTEQIETVTTIPETMERVTPKVKSKGIPNLRKSNRNPRMVG